MNACSWGSEVPPSFPRTACILAALVLAWPVPAFAQLNDTGQTQCYTTDNVATACNDASTGDTNALPGQDGRYGRDAAQAAGAMPPKSGGGVAGFDFTRICWNGAAEGSADCTGPLVANTTGAASATPSTDWACTRDNVTGLVWSLRTLLPPQETVTWDKAMVSTFPDVGHNGVKRCGHDTGWRLPTRRELLSIVLYSTSPAVPAIDLTFFPSTPLMYFWSSDPSASSSLAAWYVDFNIGASNTGAKGTPYSVRLVRNGQ